MKKLAKTLALVSAVSASIAAFSMESPVPSAREIITVQKFFLDSDVNIPLLVDIQLCSEVPSKGENKFNCENPLDESALSPGDVFYVWMNYMVPEGQESKVLVQLNQKGMTHTARTLALKSSLRYRTWARMQVPAEGEWQLPVYLRAENEMREITRLNLTVI